MIHLSSNETHIQISLFRINAYILISIINKASKATSSFSSLQDTLFTLGEKIKSLYESQEMRNVNSSNNSYPGI